MLVLQVVVIAGTVWFLVWARRNAKKPPVKPIARPRQYEFRYGR